MSPTKGNGLTADNSQPAKDTTLTNSRKFSAKSTATEAQYERIVRMLRAGDKSTLDLRRAGIMAPAARIKEMNDRLGYYIPTVELRDLWDDESFCHPRVAIYSLVDEPAHG
ncbi:MAG: helix-turn-helix domain-containing protein [Rhodoferax sp.]|nr:helix-turn-helix domain-containing protein [Rhodoferax sp.]